MTARSMGALVEYRCHTGHRFGIRTLLDQKAKNIERLLEMALAQLEVDPVHGGERAARGGEAGA